VLAGQGETHTVPAFQQGVSQGRELDGFGTGPDDEQWMGLAHRRPLKGAIRRKRHTISTLKKQARLSA
jgi:hypothetical protein